MVFYYEALRKPASQLPTHDHSLSSLRISCLDHVVVEPPCGNVILAHCSKNTCLPPLCVLLYLVPWEEVGFLGEHRIKLRLDIGWEISCEFSIAQPDTKEVPWLRDVLGEAATSMLVMQVVDPGSRCQLVP